MIIVEIFTTILQSGNARVMAHDPLQSMIVVSKPSTSSLVSAYGLAKVRNGPFVRLNLFYYIYIS